jgi:CRISPR-associated protein Csm3
MTIPTVPQLLGKLKITSILKVKTGLHIGGSGDNLDIGGLDKAVIRDPVTNQPYLPGSSIKGKLRSILELFLNEPLNRVTYSGGQPLYRHECDSIENWLLSNNSNANSNSHVGASGCPVCRVFGSTGSSKTLVQTSEGNETIKGQNYPARLIVRDAHMLEASAKKLEALDTGLYMTEWKFENGLDRITAAANPRQVERVPAGAEFHFEIVYSVESLQLRYLEEDLKNLMIALAILEDDSLGGHGSRGYGKVEFSKIQFFPRSRAQYEQGQYTKTASSTFEDLEELLQKFGDVTSNIRNLLPSSSSQ